MVGLIGLVVEQVRKDNPCQEEEIDNDTYDEIAGAAGVALSVVL